MSAAIKLVTREDAYALLQRMGATPHLLPSGARLASSTMACSD